MISEEAQAEIQKLQLEHPNKRIMVVAEKGTMGVGSSRMSGVNNVALWTGNKQVPTFHLLILHQLWQEQTVYPQVFKTVQVTVGIGIDLKNWEIKRTKMEI